MVIFLGTLRFFSTTGYSSSKTEVVVLTDGNQNSLTTLDQKIV